MPDQSRDQAPEQYEESAAQKERRQMWRDVDSSWTMSAELLTATFVWGGIGWLVDRWLDTDPWFLASGFLVGFALGMYLVMVRANRQFNNNDEELGLAQQPGQADSETN